MYKVLFICHGNICRSPMAEYLFRDMVKKLGREQEFEISSSAVSRETIWNGKGEPIYPPAKKILDGLGISCADKRSKELTEREGEYFDYLICMDESNVARAKRIVGVKNGHKCQKLLWYVGESGEVADPWYTRDFTQTERDIRRGLKGFLAYLDK